TRSGWLRRRFPAGELAQWIPKDATAIANRIKSGTLPFVPQAADLRRQYREQFPNVGDSLARRAGRVLDGEFEYFSGQRHRFEAGVPDWFLNPFTRQQADPHRHWSESGFYSPEQGDLKFQLEP